MKLTQSEYTGALVAYNAPTKQPKYPVYRITTWFDVIGMQEAIALVRSTSTVCRIERRI